MHAILILKNLSESDLMMHGALIVLQSLSTFVAIQVGSKFHLSMAN
jgi:hypothetical protein